LDIGPTGDGRIPVIMQQRLIEMGGLVARKRRGDLRHTLRRTRQPVVGGNRPDRSMASFKVTYNLMEQIGQEPKKGVASKQLFFTKKPDALYAITTGWLPDSADHPEH
jgi:alpha-L-fucosidase